jgi:multicomponent Na+:H+ antiporter subunit E
MIAFLWNVLLAVVWALAFGDLSLSNLLIGFVLGYVILWFARGVFPSAEYCARVPRLLEFALYFLWELLLSNLRVAYDVLTPTHHMRPGIIAVPLDATTDGEITLLASFISLTPGTLSLDVSADRRTLYIHAMYLRDPGAEKRRIKTGLERRLLSIVR